MTTGVLTPRECAGCGARFAASRWQAFCEHCTRPPRCECDDPIPERDEDGLRCFRCGCWLDGANPDRRSLPRKEKR
jgi:hypothetical protein